MSRPDTVYGRHPVMELLRSRPDEIRRLHVMEGKTRGPLSEIVDAAQDARIKIVWTQKRDLNSLAGGGVHQGVVARESLPVLGSRGHLGTRPFARSTSIDPGPGLNSRSP